ncbi:response regulator [Vibrio rotiferianus]|uniref:response regulator n=1 Tax=Vibrio rotiferianus TaxID=190895 RepID=UPI00406A5C40
MDILNLFYLMTYPKAITLVVTAGFVLAWIGYFINSLVRKHYVFKSGYYLYYIGYSFSLCMWILTNVYFHTELPLQLEKTLSIGLAILSNLFAYSAFAFAYTFSCLLSAGVSKPELKLTQKIVLLAFSAVAITINLVPGLTVIDVTFTAPSEFTIQFGQLTSLFFTLVFVLIILTLKNLFFIKGSKFKLIKVRSNYMIAGIVIFMLSTLTIQVGMTFFLNDFSLTWLPPALSISEMLFVGYALLTSRFYSARYLTYIVITAVLTAVMYSIPFVALYIPLSENHQLIAAAFICLFIGITWQSVFTQVSRYTSFLIYGEVQTPVQQILSLESAFKDSIDDAMHQLAFLLNISSEKLRLVTSSYNDTVYENYLPNSKSALVFDELVERLEQSYSTERELKQLHEKMSSNKTALVLPLFGKGKSVTHLLISPHKIDNALFSNEEISALQTLLNRVQSTIEADRKIKQSRALANSIAHEMRNPLAQVQLQFEKLKQHIEKKSDESETLHDIEKGQSAILRGRQLIDIILREVSDTSQEHEPNSQISIQAAVQQAVQRYGFENAEASQRIHLSTSNDFIANLNETLFSFVIFNLLRNAIYYFDSYPHSQIEIQFETGQYENVLVFRDSGPGIDENILHRVFEDFFSHQKSGGSGLGLGYCQRVMRSFGGRIECQSVMGQYTEFYLYFPALPNAKAPLNNKPSKLQPLSPQPNKATEKGEGLHFGNSKINAPTILIVDDKEVQRALVQMYLDKLQVNTIQANNGETAVNIFKSNHIDLVLMDVQMPIMNGFEASRKIKELSPKTPIIALSGESGTRELELIQELMDDRLSKPTTIAALNNILDRWLNNQHTREGQTAEI